MVDEGGGMRKVQNQTTPAKPAMQPKNYLFCCYSTLTNANIDWMFKKIFLEKFVFCVSYA